MELIVLYLALGLLVLLIISIIFGKTKTTKVFDFGQNGYVELDDVLVYITPLWNSKHRTEEFLNVTGYIQSSYGNNDLPYTCLDQDEPTSNQFASTDVKTQRKFLYYLCLNYKSAPAQRLEVELKRYCRLK